MIGIIIAALWGVYLLLSYAISDIPYYGWTAGVLILAAPAYILEGIKIVDQWDRLVILHFGKFRKVAGPGIVWIEPLFNRVADDWDIRALVDTISIANVATHDNVRLNLQLVFTRDIQDVQKLTLNVEDGWQASTDRATAVVAEAIGNSTLDQVLQDRVALANNMRNLLQDRIASWGVRVIGLEISDIKVADAEIERALSMKARAEKEAGGELLRARLQQQIADELNKASSSMNEGAWRLKGMEVLIELCRSAQNNTIVVPSNIGELVGTLIRGNG